MKEKFKFLMYCSYRMRGNAVGGGILILASSFNIIAILVAFKIYNPFDDLNIKREWEFLVPYAAYFVLAFYLLDRVFPSEEILKLHYEKSRIAMGLLVLRLYLALSLGMLAVVMIWR